MNSRINSTNSPASDAGNVKEPRLMAQAVTSACRSGGLCSQSGGGASAYTVAAMM
jgi:hypothetical protein